MKNLVLIGMPGCGKSSLGRAAAEWLGLDFLDMDEEIARREGMDIPALFAKRGEDYFRDKETECAAAAARRTGTVLSTGGGVVLREENMRLLGETGIIVFIDRPLELILQSADLSGRPLLAEGREKIYRLYDERIEKYRRFGTFRVENRSEPERAAEAIAELYRREGGRI